MSAKGRDFLLLRFRVLTVQGPRYIHEVPRSSRAAGCDQKTMHRAIAERGLAVDALDRGNCVSPCRMRDGVGINKKQNLALGRSQQGASTWEMYGECSQITCTYGDVWNDEMRAESWESLQTVIPDDPKGLRSTAMRVPSSTNLASTYYL